MGCILFSGRYGVLKLGYCTFDISWQVHVDCSVLLVPCHIETTILGTGPISGDFVFSAKHIHEVVSIFFSFVFDAKVVNDKSESYGVPFVRENTRGVLDFMAA